MHFTDEELKHSGACKDTLFCLTEPLDENYVGFLMHFCILHLYFVYFCIRCKKH